MTVWLEIESRYPQRSLIGFGHVTAGNPSSLRIVISIMWLGIRITNFWRFAISLSPSCGRPFRTLSFDSLLSESQMWEKKNSQECISVYYEGSWNEIWLGSIWLQVCDRKIYGNGKTAKRLMIAYRKIEWDIKDVPDGRMRELEENGIIHNKLRFFCEVQVKV